MTDKQCLALMAAFLKGADWMTCATYRVADDGYGTDHYSDYELMDMARSILEAVHREPDGVAQ